MNRMRVARWILLLVAALVPGIAQPQGSAKVFKVGFLVMNTTHPEDAVIALLKSKGFLEGQNFVAERRRAEGHPERLPALAAELVRLDVDVLVAFTNTPAFAARAATSTIPIVVWAAHDAVGTGLVASLARPGGNVTGVESLAPLLDAKRIQFLRELLPATRRLGVIYDPADPGTITHLRVAREAARAVSISLLPLEISDRDGVDRLLEAIEKQRPDALLTFTDPITNDAFDRVAEAARVRRLPTLCEFRVFVQRGCLLSYGATLAEFNERVARFVERILRGEKPADLPVEQATRFELVVSQKVAREIGIVFPPSILLQADQVIE